MKTARLTLALSLILVTSQIALSAEAGKWEGPGVKFDVKGNPAGNYDLSVENTKVGQVTQSIVTISLANGSTQKMSCTITEKGKEQWTSKCDHGVGGGHCFGEGLCISYEEDGPNDAFATTIALDGPDDMRLLRTHLRNGSAVEFFREKLHKR